MRAAEEQTIVGELLSNVALRIVAGVVGVLALVYGLWFWSNNLSTLDDLSRRLIFLPIPVGALMAAAILLLFASGRGTFLWLKVQQYGMSALLGGLILGGIGFFGGFVGPLVFVPESAQGPLLGIMITGPIGFVLGCIAGFVVTFVKRSRKDTQ